MIKTFEKYLDFTTIDDTTKTIVDIVKSYKLPPRRTPRIYHYKMINNILWLIYGFKFKSKCEKFEKTEDMKNFADNLKVKLLQVENVEDVEIDYHAYLEPLNMKGSVSAQHPKSTSIYSIKCHFNEDLVDMNKQSNKYNL